MPYLNLSISGGTNEPMNINVGLEVTDAAAGQIQQLLNDLLMAKLQAVSEPATEPGTDLTTTS